MIIEQPSTHVADNSQAATEVLSVFLPHRVTDRGAPTNGEAGNGHGPLAEAWDRSEPRLQLAGLTLAQLEKVAITQTLQLFGGNRTKAARKLGISVRTLQRKLRMWGSARDAAAMRLS